MNGFDPKFVDFPDYIIGVTKELWEDRRVAKLHDYYAPDIVVRSPASVVVGNKDVIAATMATLAEFPDRNLLGEDVIWCGTHEGYGTFGEPTVADVFVLGATHVEYGELISGKPKLRREWTLYDETAIWKQILLQTD